ncbi:MAG: GIY-YIG nuclease family protein [Alphaproteobacteria bacterium]
MIISSYGLFWRADEVEWFPGNGKTFALYGRRGKMGRSFQACNFWRQEGIYILYGNLGSYYGGLTKHLGYRLRDHQRDKHKKKWDRFSWFGFRTVLRGKDDHGLQKLGRMPTAKSVNPRYVIKDLEALVLKAMAVQNQRFPFQIGQEVGAS